MERLPLKRYIVFVEGRTQKLVHPFSYLNNVKRLMKDVDRMSAHDASGKLVAYKKGNGRVVICK